ncbi:MAG: RNA polymerase factor sigma-54 [Gammaproteobacteria bacterium]|nr:RNA polymerase factor sigma-54 [Gammaproteobacteria bacterium]
MSAMRTGFQQTVALRNRTVPRMGQSIHLLQMTKLELATAIEQELADNPLLEIDESQSETENLHEPLDEPNSLEIDADDYESDLDDYVEHGPEEYLDRLDPDESIEREIEWDDQLTHLASPSESNDSDLVSLLENRAKSDTLMDHLCEQLRLSGCTEDEARIAEILFEFLDEDGFVTLAEETLLAEVQRFVACTLDELEDVLILVQGFSPLGVCARNLQECLIIQTRALAGSDERVPVAMRILREAFDPLSNQRIDIVTETLGMSPPEIDDALALIKHLNPRPASGFSSEQIEYIKPEARVRKVGDTWQVEMLDDSVPQLKISDWYAEYRRSVGRKSRRQYESSIDAKDREYLKECHSRAKLLLSSLRFRNFNVMRILWVVVAKQQAFFDQGEGAMQPLLLADVADEIGLHNSTVSRLTTGKYLETPRGVYELKYFFSNRVGNQPGKEHSGLAIRAVLKNLIQAEDPGRPLSDQAIAARLKESNIEISRRTVTKYRESLAIPSSKERRQVA